MPRRCYARVSNHNQKEDLQRQQDMLEAYCAAKGWQTEVASGIEKDYVTGTQN
jgi:predicted site-specific integrase-resolvase